MVATRAEAELDLPVSSFVEFGRCFCGVNLGALWEKKLIFSAPPFRFSIRKSRPRLITKIDTITQDLVIIIFYSSFLYIHSRKGSAFCIVPKDRQLADFAHS